MTHVTRHELMLNPPLSLLPDELFIYIVSHVAKLPFSIEHLRNLSITDRAFTRFCQTHIFKDLDLGYGSGTKSQISRNLSKMKKILDDNPSFSNRVRVVDLTISHKRNGWLFNDPTFISIMQLLAKSSTPPHTLRLSGLTRPFIFEEPVLIVGRLMQSFFSQTLTVLHLDECKSVPLTIFLICPGLRDIHLDDVEASGESYDKFPDEQCSGRELPTLGRLDYRKSESLVKQMITPPPGFHTGVVIWSKLRVLTLSPHEEEEMACLQPILDAASNTLEELYLTNLQTSLNRRQLSLAGLVNLGGLSCLHVFALYAIIKCNAQESVVLRDINLVLSTIPTSNKVTSLSFDFSIYGKYPFHGCLEEDWVGLCDEIIRISGGKHLKLNFEVWVSPPNHQYPPPRQDELYERIMEKTRPLSEYPNIRTHVWHPTPGT